MTRSLRRFFSFLLAVFLFVPVCATAASAVAVRYTYDDALLYTIDSSNQLHYDVAYKAKVAKNAIVVGCGLEDLADLKGILGKADAPAKEFSIHPGSRSLGRRVTANLAMNGKGQITVITITSITQRPIVGISWAKKKIEDSHILLAEILERNGAYAVYLPRIRTEEEAREALHQIDGVFVTGGDGWNPELYGDTQTPHGSVGRNVNRDTSDLHLLQQALAMDIPLLAVCRGMQGMNIALGGSLIQDIPYYLGQQVLSGQISSDRVTAVLSGSLPGWDPVPDGGYMQYLPEENRFSKSYDGDYNTYRESSGCQYGHLRLEIDHINHQGDYHSLSMTADNSLFSVSHRSKWLLQMLRQDQLDNVLSLHHQAIDPQRLGKGLTVVAQSSDGIIEAVEYQDNLFALGLQWHPEKDALSDSRGIPVSRELNNAPIQALVKYARIRRANRVTDTSPSGIMN